MDRHPASGKISFPRSGNGARSVAWDWSDPEPVRDSKADQLRQWFEAQFALRSQGKPDAISPAACHAGCGELPPPEVPN